MSNIKKAVNTCLDGKSFRGCVVLGSAAAGWDGGQAIHPRPVAAIQLPLLSATLQQLQVPERAQADLLF